tara:strand:- start:380 stop:751 length:372 start_codon:yes stop_codon:yes gene_type:complete
MSDTYLDKIFDDVYKGNTDKEILLHTINYYYVNIEPKDYYTIKFYMNEFHQKLINIISVIESKNEFLEYKKVLLKDINAFKTFHENYFKNLIENFDHIKNNNLLITYFYIYFSYIKNYDLLFY